MRGVEPHPPRHATPRSQHSAAPSRQPAQRKGGTRTSSSQPPPLVSIASRCYAVRGGTSSWATISCPWAGRGGTRTPSARKARRQAWPASGWVTLLPVMNRVIDPHVLLGLVLIPPHQVSPTSGLSSPLGAGDSWCLAASAGFETAATRGYHWPSIPADDLAHQQHSLPMSSETEWQQPKRVNRLGCVPACLCVHCARHGRGVCRVCVRDSLSCTCESVCESFGSSLLPVSEPQPSMPRPVALLCSGAAYKPVNFDNPLPSGGVHNGVGSPQTM